jgi:hypothetical protein
MSDMRTFVDFQSLEREDAVDLPRQSDEINKGDEVLVTGKKSRLCGVLGLVSGVKVNFDSQGRKRVASYLVRGSSNRGADWVAPTDLRHIYLPRSVVGISAGVISEEVDV